MVGIGPGGKLDRTRRAEEAIARSDTVAGYSRYLALIADLTAGKTLISSGMTQEVERCAQAVERAAAGERVALVSSGDAGVYGMAGLALELIAAKQLAVDVEIVAGVTAANAAAARMGAPLMLDYATISLSDLLVPWATIRKRLEAVAAADLVVALYNPASTKRRRQLEEAAEIFRKHRPPSTPVGIGTAIGTDEERVEISTLADFMNCEIGMRSLVIIGNSTSQILQPQRTQRKNENCSSSCSSVPSVAIRQWFVTPRGYEV